MLFALNSIKLFVSFSQLLIDESSDFRILFLPGDSYEEIFAACSLSEKFALNSFTTFD
jgi:hypothetical protein